MIASRLTELRTLTDSGAPTLKRAEAVQMIRELCDEVQKLQRRREAAKGPTLSEVMAYAKARDWPAGMAEEFFDHYDMIGWVYGKCRHPIRKIPAAMSTWERNEKKRNGTNGSHPKSNLGIG